MNPSEPFDALDRRDPSQRTSEAIHREIGAIQRDLRDAQDALRLELANRQDTRQREASAQKELFDAQLSAIETEFRAKIEAINDATLLRLKAVDKIPDDIAHAVGHHEDLQQERFKSIAQQFAERDIRTQQAQEASAQALAAALQAAKELVGAQGEASAAAAVKSETSFTKQIDQIGTIIQTLEKALDARITELKERIDRGEGNATGATMQRTENRGNMAVMYGVGGLILGIVMAAIAVFAKI